MSGRKIQYWVIPPKSSAEFAANMEEVPEVYEKPYNPENPVICMDEQPVQLIKESRQPIPGAENHPRRVDYEYERNGTACIFMFTEPLPGRREAVARPRRTKADRAVETVRILEGRYADCGKITLVSDNLNTHTKGAFYEVSEPERARNLVRQINFCYTPKHGSRLNTAENELSAMTGQCISGRRIGDIETLQREIRAWSIDVNDRQRGVEWHMKISDAGFKLKSVYPKIKF